MKNINAFVKQRDYEFYSNGNACFEHFRLIFFYHHKINGLQYFIGGCGQHSAEISFNCSNESGDRKRKYATRFVISASQENPKIQPE